MVYSACNTWSIYIISACTDTIQDGKRKNRERKNKREIKEKLEKEN